MHIIIKIQGQIRNRPLQNVFKRGLSLRLGENFTTWAKNKQHAGLPKVMLFP